MRVRATKYVVAVLCGVAFVMTAGTFALFGVYLRTELDSSPGVAAYRSIDGEVVVLWHRDSYVDRKRRLATTALHGPWRSRPIVLGPLFLRPRWDEKKVSTDKTGKWCPLGKDERTVNHMAEPSRDKFGLRS